MSDLENSDDEIYESKKDINNYDDIDKEKKKKLSKKIISDYKIDSEEDDELEDEDELVNDSDDDLDEIDDEIDDLLELNEDELVSKNLSTKEKILDESIINNLSPINSDIESDDEENLQKFDFELNNDFIKKYHKESLFANSNEIEILSRVTRDENGIIIDDNHKTLPILSKYERAKILGQRAKQINNGDKVYIQIPDNIIDSYLIAELELKAKKLPFIIKRPIIGGNSEYWKIKDLEQIN